METMTLKDVQEFLGVGRRRAEIYAKESGALLPRTKGSEYRIRKELFLKWAEGERNENS